ncbi:cytochrome P450 [Moelleriella libera RCEF 2490]|uniref:Cytochrome P450 n=1 Tax=Moelleriella libera RCEF 2490 TaxID=1081109 RepID=A0A166N8Q6_9HYPO|nr:cytochrome P450 [Moelleriella libera RCEF 2490]
MHNMIEMTKESGYWTPELLSQSLLGIWFAASHQPWLNLHFVIVELCNRQDWQVTLRQEIEANDPQDYGTLEGLPLLDAFIKETIRVKPLDTLAIRRKALEPYTFASGGGSIHVPQGATVCVPMKDILSNPSRYAQPESFQPHRHISRGQGRDQHSKFTDVSETFPLWGYGSLACPGRIYASVVIKLILVELLKRFSLELRDPAANTRWYWETFTLPYETTRVIFRPR